MVESGNSNTVNIQYVGPGKISTAATNDVGKISTAATNDVNDQKVCSGVSWVLFVQF